MVRQKTTEARCSCMGHVKDRINMELHRAQLEREEWEICRLTKLFGHEFWDVTRIKNAEKLLQRIVELAPIQQEIAASFQTLGFQTSA